MIILIWHILIELNFYCLLFKIKTINQKKTKMEKSKNNNK